MDLLKFIRKRSVFGDFYSKQIDFAEKICYIIHYIIYCLLNFGGLLWHTQKHIT